MKQPTDFLNSARKILKKRASEPRANFMLLLKGFSIFMFGLSLVIIAEFSNLSLILAEIVALLGIMAISLGILIAAIGYLSLSVLRVLWFIGSNEDESEKDTNLKAESKKKS